MYKDSQIAKISEQTYKEYNVPLFKIWSTVLCVHGVCGSLYKSNYVYKHCTFLPLYVNLLQTSCVVYKVI